MTLTYHGSHLSEGRNHGTIDEVDLVIVAGTWAKLLSEFEEYKEGSLGGVRPPEDFQLKL